MAFDLTIVVLLVTPWVLVSVVFLGAKTTSIRRRLSRLRRPV